MTSAHGCRAVGEHGSTCSPFAPHRRDAGAPRRARRDPADDRSCAGASFGAGADAALGRLRRRLRVRQAAVPLDHRRPNRTSIDLDVIRHPAVDQAHRIGTLFAAHPRAPSSSSAMRLPARSNCSPSSTSSDSTAVGTGSTAVDCGIDEALLEPFSSNACGRARSTTWRWSPPPGVRASLRRGTATCFPTGARRRWHETSTCSGPRSGMPS